MRKDVHKNNQRFFQKIKEDFPGDFYVITPQLALNRLKLVIFYAHIKEGLVCAAAVNTTECQAEQSALKELYIHAVGLYRMKKYNIVPCTLYEKRILWISQHIKKLKKRLSFQGNQSINIPYPVIFQDIETDFSQAYVVQRCILDGYDDDFLVGNEIWI